MTSSLGPLAVLPECPPRGRLHCSPAPRGGAHPPPHQALPQDFRRPREAGVHASELPSFVSTGRFRKPSGSSIWLR